MMNDANVIQVLPTTLEIVVPALQYTLYRKLNKIPP